MIRRGEIWSIKTSAGTARLVLTIGADYVFDQELYIPVVPVEATGSVRPTLVTVPVSAGQIIGGVAVTINVATVPRDLLLECHGKIAPEQQERLDAALRAVLDL